MAKISVEKLIVCTRDGKEVESVLVLPKERTEKHEQLALRYPMASHFIFHEALEVEETLMKGK